MKYIKKIIVLLVNLRTALQIRAKGKNGRVFLMLLPQYANWGDFAIQISEETFLKSLFMEKKLIRISIQFYTYFSDFIEKNIVPTDLLLITGGGWLGDLYPYLNDSANNIIERFPENAIVILPQTIYFTQTGSPAFHELKKVYSKHKHLYVCLREQRSYDFFKEYIYESKPEQILFMPDFVTRLNYSNAGKRRQGVLLCLRSDLEKGISDDTIETISDCLKQYFSRITYTTTAYSDLPLLIPFFIGKALTKLKIRQFSKCEMVVTDRLHGMIFAAITGTPCIAFDNTTGKVRGVYSYLNHLAYIRIVSDTEEFKSACAELAKKKDCKYDNQNVLEQYKRLEVFLRRLQNFNK